MPIFFGVEIHPGITNLRSLPYSHFHASIFNRQKNFYSKSDESTKKPWFWTKIWPKVDKIRCRKDEKTIKSNRLTLFWHYKTSNLRESSAVNVVDTRCHHYDSLSSVCVVSDFKKWIGISDGRDFRSGSKTHLFMKKVDSSVKWRKWRKTA